MKKFIGFEAREMTPQQAIKFIRMYERSKDYSIENVYKIPSYAKCWLENDIRERMKGVHGFGYRVLFYNTLEFSAGYIVEDISGLYLIVESYKGIYYYRLER